jgi:hypothetical protein
MFDLRFRRVRTALQGSEQQPETKNLQLITYNVEPITYNLGGASPYLAKLRRIIIEFLIVRRGVLVDFIE